MYTPISDYAVIGNLKSAALVSKNGSIDWAPAPFIDSPSIFASILDDRIGGRWQITLASPSKAQQNYVDNTNILRTQQENKKGRITIIDFIPVEKDKESLVSEDQAIFEIYRKVTCEEGVCDIDIYFEPRFDYGRADMVVFSVPGGVAAEGKEKKSVLASNRPLDVSGKSARANFSLKKGEEIFFLLRFNTLNIPENIDVSFSSEFSYTKAFWERWVSHCDNGTCQTTELWRDHVIRSALVLKILFFEPTGAVAAAPTTSLPEEIGGVRNWDYRYSWVRDSAFVFSALLDIGHVHEAEKYLQWILNTCACEGDFDPARMQIMYGLDGRHNLEEEYLTHLYGYRGSKPVRVGNRAYLQKQWDIYGSIFDILWRVFEAKKSDDIIARYWPMMRAIADYVIEIWREPDEGLWEVRGGKKHFVYSKVMCWVALDRAIRLAKAFGLDVNLERWKREKETIRQDIFSKGWSSNKKSFVQAYGVEAVDTALLRLPVVGFIDGKDPRMLSTIAAIEKELLTSNGFFYRYLSEDGLPGKEGAFLAASFWYVDALVLAGRVSEAATIFTRTIEYANHVKLFSEEIDPQTGEFLGNFPQAYTHIGLINSAIRLNRVGVN